MKYLCSFVSIVCSFIAGSHYRAFCFDGDRKRLWDIAEALFFAVFALAYMVRG